MDYLYNDIKLLILQNQKKLSILENEFSVIINDNIDDDDINNDNLLIGGNNSELKVVKKCLNLLKIDKKSIYDEKNVEKLYDILYKHLENNVDIDESIINSIIKLFKIINETDYLKNILVQVITDKISELENNCENIQIKSKKKIEKKIIKKKLPIDFKYIEVKSDADSQFASISNVLDDVIFYKMIKTLDISSYKKEYKYLKYLYKHIDNFFINALPGKGGDIKNINKSQQILRHILYYYVDTYAYDNSDSFWQDIHSLTNKNNEYKKLKLPKYNDAKNMNMSEKNIQSRLKKLKKLFIKSEQFIKKNKKRSAYYGDNISIKIIGDFLYKYFQITPVVISASKLDIDNNEYIDYLIITNTYNTKYIIFIKKELINEKYYYQALQYYNENTKLYIKLFSTNKDNLQKYPKELQNFITNLIK